MPKKTTERDLKRGSSRHLFFYFISFNYVSINTSVFYIPCATQNTNQRRFYHIHENTWNRMKIQMFSFNHISQCRLPFMKPQVFNKTVKYTCGMRKIIKYFRLRKHLQFLAAYQLVWLGSTKRDRKHIKMMCNIFVSFSKSVSRTSRGNFVDRNRCESSQFYLFPPLIVLIWTMDFHFLRPPRYFIACYCITMNAGNVFWVRFG